MFKWSSAAFELVNSATSPRSPHERFASSPHSLRRLQVRIVVNRIKPSGYRQPEDLVDVRNPHVLRMGNLSHRIRFRPNAADQIFVFWNFNRFNNALHRTDMAELNGFLIRDIRRGVIRKRERTQGVFLRTIKTIRTIRKRNCYIGMKYSAVPSRSKRTVFRSVTPNPFQLCRRFRRGIRSKATISAVSA